MSDFWHSRYAEMRKRVADLLWQGRKAKRRIAELEAQLDTQTKRAACAEQEWARVEKYATEVRAAYQEASEKLLALEAQIGPLRRIAYYANKLDGGASSNEQWREILHAQREAMEPFTDDAFNELKPATKGETL